MTTPSPQPTVEQDGQAQGASRLRSSGTVLTRMFVAVAVLAVVVIGVVNVVGALRIFTATIDSQLSSLATDRAGTVTNELEHVKAQVAVLAQDASIAAASRDLVSSFTELGESGGELTASQEQELVEFYARDEIASGAVEESAAIPQSMSGQYVQYHYIVDNPDVDSDRALLVDAGDGSAYSQMHSQYHPMLRARAELLAVEDLLLIDLGATSEVVYSVSKRIDVGTSLQSGPYRDSTLGVALAERLDTVPPGEAILVDFDRYVPAGGSPTMFAVAAVRDKTEVVGAVAVALRGDFLDSITTFDGGWESVNVGDTGEMYLVGSDSLMRSVSRMWVEDPASYLSAVEKEGYPPEVSAAINDVGTTVLGQPVATDAVAAALNGSVFSDGSKSYLGVRTFVFSQPLAVPDLDWVIVSEFARSEARGPLWGYLITLGLLALAVIPVVTIIAVYMGRRLTRPVEPLVGAADAIASGDVDVEIPALGRNEYGDLGNRINTLTRELRERDDRRREEERSTSQVLLAALPPRLVEGVRGAIKDGTITVASDFSDLISDCTVIAVSVRGYFDLGASDMEQTLEVSTELAKSVEELARQCDLERARSTPGDFVFSAGLQSEGHGTADAVRFVGGLLVLLAELQEETAHTGEFRIGVSSGQVASGLLRGNEISFGTWGAPVRTAMLLSQIADPYQALVDEVAAEEFENSWDLRRVETVDLQGSELVVFALDDSSSPST